MGVLDKYEPEKALMYFETISSIPRDSLKEHKIADYLVNFAEQRGLEVKRDDYNNVLIRKPASPGYEHCDPMILQGHSDMVCIKEEGFDHDFEKDGLKLYVEDGLIKARGTTLGADNGIALAYGLAVLDSQELSHPELEVVFTSAEEIGMVGAKHFDMSWLRGKNMISFDSGGFTEGRIYVGCAGGEKFQLSKKVKYEPVNPKKVFQITVKGLKGGHAGGDIAKGRGNASVIAGRLLHEAAENMETVHLLNLQCGDPNNPIKHSIPNKAVITLACDEGQRLEAVVNGFYSQVARELAGVDEDVCILIEEMDAGAEAAALCRESLWDIIDTLVLLPDGVLSMHKYFTDTPETSSNVGSVELDQESLCFYVSSRSSKESGLDFIQAKLDAISRWKGYEQEKSERIVGWDYNPNSKLKKLIEDQHNIMYKKNPRFKITHASTECGMFKQGIKDLDVISIGPIIYEEHTVNEYMEIVSVNELWKFLCVILRESNNL